LRSFAPLRISPAGSRCAHARITAQVRILQRPPRLHGAAIAWSSRSLVARTGIAPLHALRKGSLCVSATRGSKLNSKRI